MPSKEACLFTGCPRNRRLPFGRVANVSWVLPFLLNSSPSVALELGGDLYTDTIYSSNETKASTNPRHELSQKVGINLQLTENRKKLQADANLNFEYQDYLRNTFDDETTLKTGFGLVNFGLIDAFFDWKTSFTRTEALTNPLDADIPPNRDYRNVLRTGPVVNYKMSEANRLSLQAQYVYTENSDDVTADTKRADSSARLTHLYNTLTSFYINGNYQSLFDGDGLEEYDRRTLSVGVTRRFSKGFFDVQVGNTNLDFESTDSRDADYLNARVERDDVFSHTVFASYSEDVTDTSIGLDQSLELAEANSSLSLQDVANGLSDIIELERYTMGVSRVWTSFAYTLTGFYVTEEYQAILDQEEQLGVNLRLSQKVDSFLTLGLSYTHNKTEFVSLAESGINRRNIYRFDAVHALAKDFSWEPYLQWDERRNADNSAREYEEFSVGFALRWTFL